MRIGAALQARPIRKVPDRHAVQRWSGRLAVDGLSRPGKPQTW